ncbi:MAG TPA: hypothetical protein VMR45_04130 [Patescibacteria group bacterium]|jgi:arginine exporter protein ArgO|nr:hypothetical protein [Patescibacteria group bacterium]
MFSAIYTFFATTVSSGCDPNKTFFGIPVWYKYLIKTASPGPCNFDNVQLWPPNNLILIGVALLDMLLRVAGMVAFAFIIWGGIEYVTSQGEPEKTKQAMHTIINALVGLVIAIIAVTLVAFIGNRFGG